MSTARPTLTPEMLLFEVAAMCSRHGIPVDTSHPSAAVHYAGQLLRTLGVPVAAEAPPAALPAADRTTELPRVEPPAPGLRVAPLPRGADDPPRRRHALDRDPLSRALRPVQ